MPYNTIMINGVQSQSMTPDRVDREVFGYYTDTVFVQNGAGGWDRTDEQGKFPVYKETNYWPNGSITVDYSYEDSCEALRGCTESDAIRMCS